MKELVRVSAPLSRVSGSVAPAHAPVCWGRAATASGTSPLFRAPAQVWPRTSHSRCPSSRSSAGQCCSGVFGAIPDLCGSLCNDVGGCAGSILNAAGGCCGEGVYVAPQPNAAAWCFTHSLLCFRSLRCFGELRRPLVWLRRLPRRSWRLCVLTR